MKSKNLKISKLYYAVDGTREAFEVEAHAEDFEGLPLTGPVRASGELMRVEEGIMMLMQSLEATQTAECSRCAKPLKEPLQFHASEWLYYETKPDKDDASNELLFLDKHQMEIDPYEPLRQELSLNINLALHCKKECKTFEEKTAKLKPLAQLKDLL